MTRVNIVDIIQIHRECLCSILIVIVNRVLSVLVWDLINVSERALTDIKYFISAEILIKQA